MNGARVLAECQITDSEPHVKSRWRVFFFEQLRIEAGNQNFWWAGHPVFAPATNRDVFPRRQKRNEFTLKDFLCTLVY
jgi:hypothetical protein